MKRSHIFLFISIIGICYTWFYNIQYFMSYEDASLVHFVWFIPDARKLKIKAWWVIIPLTFLIAVAFSFPFYLYLRERTLEKKV
jgi:hypothetical protein